MIRSATLCLKFATSAKKARLIDLLVAYRSAVNFYIGLCWDQGGSFNAVTLRKLEWSALSYRYKGQALKQACGIVSGTRKAARELGIEPGKPIFDGGADLSINHVEASCDDPNHFDVWFRFSTLTKGDRIDVPAHKTRVFNRWCLAGKPIEGGTLFEHNGNIYFRVSFEIADPITRTTGDVLGIDRGVRNVITTSSGEQLGQKLDHYIERIKRTVPASRGRIRALRARDQYVNECVKRLPFNRLSVLAIEDLKNIKRGKRGKLRRATNRRFSHWTIGRMSGRLEQLCQENGVLLAEVPAAYTSQTCPACGHVEKGNRRGDSFLCRRCDYAQHADVVGAKNVLDRYLGTISVPHAKVQICKL